MQIDFRDGTLFGNDAGEDERPEILNSYFVDQPSFRSFFERGSNFRVARSRKGMGKSALLSKLAYDLRNDPSNPIVINATGASLIGLLAKPKDMSYLSLQSYWYSVLLTRINQEIGNYFGFIYSDFNNAIVPASEIPSLQGVNVTSALIRRLAHSKIPIEVTATGVSKDRSSIDSIFANFPSRAVWLLVDDIDSTYVDSDEQRAITSTFFSACRALVRDIQGLQVRASVRTDVWSNLRRNEDLDKAEQYVTDIIWSADDLEVILSKKIFSYFMRNSSETSGLARLDYRRDANAVLELIFPRRVRWGSSMVPPFRPVYILSAGRPRWMSQLCRLAGEQAAKNKKNVITISEINAVSKTYSRYRLNDIYKEHSHQFTDLQKLIEAFSDGPSRFTTQDLQSQIATNYTNHVGAGSVPHIDGYPYQRPLQLAHFVYKIGFVVGRHEHKAGQVVNFVRYEERPELLVEGRNPDDSLLWEVHPSYRSALNIRNEAAASVRAPKRDIRIRRRV